MISQLLDLLSYKKVVMNVYPTTPLYPLCYMYQF